MRRMLIAIALLAGCREAQDRVRRVASPADDPAFATRCRYMEICLKDAREICPGGYQKVSVEDEYRRHELTFKCHGKPNW